MNQSSPDLQEVIEEFADLLKTCDIPYMVFGGYGVILRVPYRITFDGDFVVERTDAENIQRFVKLVEDSDIFTLLDEREARNVLAHGGLFSALSETYGIHVFVWRTGISDYWEEESGLPVAIPELIISEKLRRIKDGEADPKDGEDVIALLTSPDVSLDENTLEELAEDYGVSGLLKEFEARASSTESEDFGGVGNYGPPDSRATRVEQVAEMRKDGKSYREIADALGISQSTVGVYVGRARERGHIPEDEGRR